jgi:hypothetical protein
MTEISYRGHRFPPIVIQHAVWLYLRFTLSYRDVEELLAERGLDVSYETVRSWVLQFGAFIARRLRRAVRGRTIVGISTRWSSGSPPASICTCGARSIMKAKYSKSLFSVVETNAQPLTHAQAGCLRPPYKGLVADLPVAVSVRCCNETRCAN